MSRSPTCSPTRYAARRPGRDLVARAQDRRSSAGCGSRCSGPSATSASTYPTGVVEAYEQVVDDVDLESIAARERVTRHDVKARIEEFTALAGHEHIHKGMTSRDLTENVEQLQIRAVARARPRPRLVADTGPAGAARRRARDAGDDRPHRTTSRPRPPRSASASRPSPTSCWSRLERLDDLIARYPLRGIKGPVGTAQDSSTCSTGDGSGSPSSSSGSPATSASTRVLDQRRPGLPALARLRRRLGAGAGWSPDRPTWPPRSG